MVNQATDRQVKAALYRRQGMSRRKSMITAGYSEKYADKSAGSFFKNPVVAALLDKDEPVAKTGLTEEEFDQALVKIAMDEDIAEGNRLKALLAYGQKKGYIKGDKNEVNQVAVWLKKFESMSDEEIIEEGKKLGLDMSFEIDRYKNGGGGQEGQY